MSSVLRFQQLNSIELPDNFKSSDVRTSDELVEYFLAKFTQVNDNVFDPFLGFGTTAIIAEKEGRNGYGIEFSAERVEFIKSLINTRCNIVCGDSLKISSYDGLPLMDFSISSPPYMIASDTNSYPFSHQPTNNTFDTYLKNIGMVYNNLKNIMKPNAYVVIEACNIIHNQIFNTLAWDIAETVATHYTFCSEYIVEWVGSYKNSNFGLNHSYCFLFQNT